MRPDCVSLRSLQRSFRAGTTKAISDVSVYVVTKFPAGVGPVLLLFDNCVPVPVAGDFDVSLFFLVLAHVLK